MIIKTYDEFMRRATNCNYEGFVVGAPPMRADALAAEQCSPLSPNLRLLSLLDVRYVLLPKATDIANSTLVFHDQDQWIYDIGHGYGRAFGVSQVETADQTSCLDRLATTNDLRQQAVIDTPHAATVADSSPTVLSHQFITNGEVFQVQGGGLLVRSEVWSPGWTVTIDNVPATVEIADCTLQSVWLPGEGTHTVRFEYLPHTFVIGIILSFLTLSSVILYALFSRFKGLRLTHILERRDPRDAQRDGVKE
jgi:hypothetical protein